MKRHISIYQCPVEVDYCFRSYDANKFNFSDYNKVYEFTMCTNQDDAEICEDVYCNLQRTDYNKMSDVKMRSISMSDVVQIDDKYFYCDTFGWTEVNV